MDEKNVGDHQYLKAARAGLVFERRARTEYAGVGCAYRGFASVATIPHLEAWVSSPHMIVQLRLLREAMVFAIYASSRAVGNRTHQWSMPLCLMSVQLVFALQIAPSSRLTASLGTIFWLNVLGKVMSFDICFASKRSCVAKKDIAPVSLLVDGMGV
jgi:hypothetical protein